MRELLEKRNRELKEENEKLRREIAERKQTEEALRKDLLFLQALLDSIPISVFYKDPEGVYLHCNEMFAEKIMGRPKAEVPGKTVRAFRNTIPDELAGIYEKYDRKTLREKKPQFYEARIKDPKSGKIRDFFCSKALHTDRSGNPLGIVGVMQDITERKEAEEIIHKSEERYRIAAEETGQIIIDYDIRNMVVDWAGAIKEITGYEPEEFRKFGVEEWEEHIHPEDREKAVGTIMGALDSCVKFFTEYRFRKKDGTYIQVEDSGICLTDEEGRPYRVLAVIKDITERKRARAELEISEERYRVFMKNFKGIAFQGSMDFLPVFMHGAVEEITGYGAEAFISGEKTWYELVEPEDLPELLEYAEKLKSVPDFLAEHEYRIRHRDGEIKWVHEIIQNISDSSGKIRYLHGVLYDITEERNTRETLAKAEEIRKKEIHHRIKNNLQVISSLLELQADKFRDREVVEAFRESQNRVISMSLIHEELYRSRDVETINFSEYLKKLTDDLMRSYKVGRGEVSLEFDIEDISLQIDTAVPLGIILNELVSNSLKHAFPEGRKGKIRIELYRENEEKSGKVGEAAYVLGVSDNGVGFPKGFDFRATESLGLQLVNLLVEQIGGIIETGAGPETSFFIKFQEEGDGH